MNYYMRKFKKNTKALSPVVASIILIAVTVAVSVVVAAWMGGMTIGLMGNAEQGSMTNAVLTSPNIATVDVQNRGSASLTVSSATIDGHTAAITNTTGSAPWVIAKGASSPLTLTAAGVTFVDGAQYLIKLQTAKGNTITYTATYTAP
jgi:archaeal type IV pilus assembly protein PilA